VPNSALLQPDAVTVEAWVRLDYAASGKMVIFQQGAPGAGYALQVGADGKLQFIVDDTVVEAPSALPLGTWVHVAGSYDGAALNLYINGVAAAAQAFAVPIIYDGSGATIGAGDSDGANLWQGELQELRVWNIAQPAATLTANMAQLLGPQAGLVADWHFNETSGLTLADSSGNGLDATLGPVPGVATQLLSFNLVAGETYYLNIVTSSGAITERFYNPNGLMLFAQPIGDRAAITAEVTGPTRWRWPVISATLGRRPTASGWSRRFRLRRR
jgi:hypothetical protein